MRVKGKIKHITTVHSKLQNKNQSDETLVWGGQGLIEIEEIGEPWKGNTIGG